VQSDCFREPCIVLIVQGNKKVFPLEGEYRVKDGWYIAYGMDIPARTHITGATAAKPHLALLLPLDRYILTQLAAGIQPAEQEQKKYRGVTVGEARSDLLDACVRLVGLADTPERVAVLAPMIIREIHYLLLTGPEGEDFRLLGMYDKPSNQIARSISWLRENYREAFSVNGLAAQVNMSVTSFCRHFSRITGTTPIQYQKRLRLYEAQRLIFTEDRTAEAAAYEVGYESPTQFNREYKRQFGEPPRRSAGVLKGFLYSRNP
jgi:AraC-like DNA-binding protein